MSVPIIEEAHSHKNAEKMEFQVIDDILPLLLKKGLLSNIECRIIACKSSLSERKCAIYDIIMSTTKQKAANLTEELRTLTQPLLVKNTTGCQNSNQIENASTFSLTKEGNPFLYNTVIKNLFTFLPLADVKNFRLVCHQWNSTAEIVLRKRCLIHFRPNVLQLQTSAFLEMCKYSLPGLPYSSFKLTSKNSKWPATELTEFFDKYGKHIKDLRIQNILLTEAKDSEAGLQCYDITPWFANCSDMRLLKITTLADYDETARTTLCISLSSLASINVIRLQKSRIIINPEDENTRIAPLGINLTDISITRKGKLVKDYRADDFIDFGQTRIIQLRNLNLNPLLLRIPKLDMQRQIFQTGRLNLVNLRIENWAEAKGEVHSLNLFGHDFIQKNQLKIRELIVRGQHIIDLFALPQTIKKLKLLETNQIICTDQVDLPNINYLLYDIVDNNSHLLTHFSNCSNLVELELGGSKEGAKLYSSCIPRTVKKMKLNCVHIQFVDYYILELDTLILDDNKHVSRYADFANVTAKIKAKVLVVVVNGNSQLDAEEILKLMKLDSSKFSKIILGSSKDVDLLKATDFDKSAFSACVDNKSNYYHIENQRGKAIPREQFNVLKTMNGLI